MSKPVQPSHHTPTDGLETAANGGERDADSAASTARRPYQRPVVQKRKSVSQATLVGSGGVGGTLVGGAP